MRRGTYTDTNERRCQLRDAADEEAAAADHTSLLLLLKDFSLRPLYALQTVQPKCSHVQLAGMNCVGMHFDAAQYVARKQKSWL
jgi:hypothetical protein